MNKAQFQIIFTLVWASPVVVLALWTYVFRRLREFEEESSREAIKRTDPQVNACADELETAKPVQGDEEN